LNEWLAGEEQPTLNQLEQFSKATATPLGFLFLKDPPTEALPIPNYRTASDKNVAEPSAELLDTIYMMQRRQAWLKEFLTEEGREPVPLVRSAKLGESATVVAERLRKYLDLDADWASHQPTWSDALRTLRDELGRVGVVVVTNGIVGNNTHRPLKVSEFRGFVLVDDLAPFVFVNGADSKSAQMFTLAHELAHLAFGSSAIFDLEGLQPAPEPTERACNEVAAEFLVPTELLRKAWNSGDQHPFENLARRFKVSQLVIARRLLDLGLITRERFFAFYDAYIKQEHRQKQGDESGGNFYASTAQRIGERFANELLRALREGRVLYTEAYRLTGLSGKTFDEFAKRGGRA
jgi:Zn-dependent peptidase ImmA (M78 family)